MRLDGDLGNVLRRAAGRQQLLPQHQARFDGGVRVLTACEQLVIAVRDGPAFAKFFRQHRGLGLRSKASDEHVVDALRDAAEAERREIRGAQPGPSRDPGPQVAYQRAIEGVIVGAGEYHAGACRYGREQRVRVVAAQKPDASGGTQRAKRRVRVNGHRGERKRLCAAADDLVRQHKRAQHWHRLDAGRLRFREKRGKDVSPGMGRRQAISLVELAPCRGSPVRSRGRITINAEGLAIEHGCFRGRRALGKLGLRGLHFRLGFGSDECAEIVRERERCAPQDRVGNVRRLHAGGPHDERAGCGRRVRAGGWLRAGLRTQNHFHKSVLPLSSAAEP
jgi:hypothetical protein